MAQLDLGKRLFRRGSLGWGWQILLPSDLQNPLLHQGNRSYQGLTKQGSKRENWGSRRNCRASEVALSNPEWVRLWSSSASLGESLHPIHYRTPHQKAGASRIQSSRELV